MQLITYFIVELVIFLILLSLACLTAFRFKIEVLKIRYFILLFIIMYTISVAFSTISKYIKYTNNLTSAAEILAFSSSYGINLILQGRLKYLFSIFANYFFHLAFYEIFSLTQRRYAIFIKSCTSIVSTIYVMPIFSSEYKLFTQIGLFIHSLLIYVPILLKTKKIMSKTTGKTKRIMMGTFFIAFLLIFLLLIAVFDSIFTNYIGVAYSFFYYLGWMTVLMVVFLVFYIFVLPNWAFLNRSVGLKQKIKKKSWIEKFEHFSDPVMLITCPKCKKAKYHIIPENIQKEVGNSPSGITSLLILKDEICEHTFLVYFDKHYKVRSIQSVDYVA